MARFRKKADGMWDTLDGKDVSSASLPAFDWQKDGFRMQQTNVDVARGIDEKNDPGYIPEAESHVKILENRGFEDNAVDINLIQERSDDLRQHKGPFWHGGKAGFETEQTPEETEDNSAEAAQPRGVPWKLIGRICAGFAVAFAFLIFLRFAVFDIEEINVVGNSQISDDEIRRISGIRTGMNILTLDEDAITRRIDGNRYLKLEAIEVKSSHTVVLHVRESQELSFIRYCGIIYLLDVRGMVLNEWIPENKEKNVVDDVPDLLQVEGLDVKNCTIGRKIALNDDRQMPIYKEFVMELKAMGMEKEISTLYLTDPESIYLGTSSGFSVRTGTSERIHAKLRSLQLVLDRLAAEGFPKGTIDVSIPEVPTYIPTSSM